MSERICKALRPILIGFFALATGLCQAAVLQSVHRDYDTLGRVQMVTYPDGRWIKYEYDANGNRTKMTESVSNNIPVATTRVTSYTYDALNRLKTLTDAAGGITTFRYDGRDNVVTVDDPRRLVTTYTYNGFDDLVKQVSPDTGTTTYDYATIPGLLKTQTDARGISVITSYDGLGRPLLRNENSEKVSYTWDTAVNGRGQLHILQRTRGTNLTLTETRAYDGLARLFSTTQRTQSISPAIDASHVVTYTYDSRGRLEGIRYPSHTSGQLAQLTYQYDSQGRVSGLRFNGSDYIRNITWAPFGGIKGWTWANGLVHTRTYDQNGRVDQMNHGTLQQKNVNWDLGDRISTISDSVASRTQSYSYDTLDRLRTTTYGIRSDSYTYDADSNRLTSTSGTTSTTYSYPASSNRLQSISGARSASYVHDTAGNILQDGSYRYVYNSGGRLLTATSVSTSATTSYYVNGRGERVLKTGSTGSRIFVYDSAGHLLGEYGLDGSYQEHLWLGDIPVGNLRSGTTPTLLYVLADHLNTPRMLVNSASSPGTAVWSWNSEAFGSTAPTASSGIVYNLRFPGQYYDAETKKHYNYFRDYDPAIGRYLESDPIGLEGGINTYGYVGGNPVGFTDPLGLSPRTDAFKWVFTKIFDGCKWVIKKVRVKNDDKPNLPEKKNPKPTPKFEEPTNPPQKAPAPEDLPPGHTVREMPPTEQYPNGYWRQSDANGNPVDPSTGKTPANVTRAESRARTHVPLPPN